jgi:hypothetical protein
MGSSYYLADPSFGRSLMVWGEFYCSIGQVAAETIKHCIEQSTPKIGGIVT